MDVLAWLSDQTRYLVVSQVTLFAFAGFAAAGACSPRLAAFVATRRGTLLMLGLALLAMLAARWPTILAGLWIGDEDESDFIALAMTALHHPIPWHDFDPLTSGPFDSYVLMLPALAGLHLSFLTTAIVTFALEVFAILALYGALALCFDAGVASLGIVPPVVFWSVTIREEFYHYSSELLSISLCAAILWLLAVAWRRGYPPAVLFGIGVLCGTVPFAKLQSVPLGAILAAVALVVVASAQSLSRRERLERAGVLAVGVVAVPTVMLSVVGLSGSWHDFWMSYVLSGLAYVNYVFQPASYMLGARELGPYFDWLFGVTLVGLAVTLSRFRDVGGGQRGVFAVALVVLAAAVYCVFAPKRASEHYLLYAVIPIATTAAVALGIIFAVAARARAARAIVGVTFVVACLAIDGGFVRAHNWWADQAYPTFARAGDYDPLVTAIKSRLRDGERLAIWGFRPQYVAFTSTELGTRDPNTLLQWDVAMNPYWRYYRARYIADMEANRPEGFLDAGAESFDFTGGTKDGYDSWPELAAVVNRGYVLVARWQRYRLFVRRDLAHRGRSPRPTRPREHGFLP